MQDTLSHPRFVGAEMLGVEFLTTPEFVQSVLPPGLEPADERADLSPRPRDDHLHAGRPRDRPHCHRP